MLVTPGLTQAEACQKLVCAAVQGLGNGVEVWAEDMCLVGSNVSAPFCTPYKQQAGRVAN